ncbi:MAG TPA: ABC transporter permease [Thermotogota bacterium]|nr:ABC transporter permease [Thermotogota bacterium]HRW91666.1 ABC transporter permease [Thermotogota bacterium]
MNPRHSRAEDFRRATLRVTHHKSLVGGIVVLTILLGMALLSLLFTPYDPYAIDARARFSPPSWAHWFGTDEYGRDLFSRCMVGSRIALGVGLVSTLIAFGGGLFLGFLAGMGVRWVDELVMRTMDGLYAFPALLFAIAIVSVLGPNIFHAMVAIGVVRIPIFARQVRNSTISLKKREFVYSAKALGVGPVRIALVHLFPNLFSPLSVLVSANFAFAILSEAGLSYIGLGTQPPVPSWGRLLLESQRFFERAPWLVLFPGIMIALLVLGFSLLGDGLRDLLDPKD